ncbi:hypothetical protein [Arenibacter certesii]|uniref:Uncharacterized protein n=1 Tax=Arenibacter certesii TaxID=228955 RepID=A0A918IT95_9FLAO|nr:hypothetical protein [Arenibacter certesii]GGW26876.1 hypothetical protein GCM10007383_10210 [Arenibacter certesii]
MTPRQIEKIKTKIRSIRATLVAEKRKYGGFDDSRGLRYMPPELFIKIQDYKGGLTYLRWFDKNFNDDMGMPNFLFEWLIILFKTKNLKGAEEKAYQVFFANSYLFDKYFGRKIVPIEKYEYSNWAIPEFAEHFNYNSDQKELSDFTDWLKAFESSESFLRKKHNYIVTSKKLKNVNDMEARKQLLAELRQIESELN